EHDDKVDAALVQPAEREQVLELAAIRGLGALAFLVKAFEDLVALAAAVLFARAKLGRQAEILGLLLRADANVDHRAHHGRQIRLVRGPTQGAFSRHGIYSVVLRRSSYISTRIHAIECACWRSSATS